MNWYYVFRFPISQRVPRYAARHHDDNNNHTLIRTTSRYVPREVLDRRYSQWRPQRGTMTTILAPYYQHQHHLLSVESAFVALHRSPIRRVSNTARYSTETPDGKSRGDILLDWATDTTFSSVHIAPSTYGGCGLFASKPAKAGEVLFVVPSSKCIALSSATSDKDFGRVFEQLANDGGPGGSKTALAGFLAWQLLLNKHSDHPSKWGPYLNLLPWQTEKQNNFLWWSDEEIEDHLFDSNSCDEIISFRRGVSR